MCTLGMQGCESAWETLPSQSWAAKGLEELKGLYAVEIPDGSGISGASPHAAGCLERALQLGAFPGTQEPSREQCKENLSIPQPSTVPPGLCVIYELRIN